MVMHDYATGLRLFFAGVGTYTIGDDGPARLRKHKQAFRLL